MLDARWSEMFRTGSESRGAAGREAYAAVSAAKRQAQLAVGGEGISVHPGISMHPSISMHPGIFHS